jgi:hypothetical protein
MNGTGIDDVVPLAHSVHPMQYKFGRGVGLAGHIVNFDITTVLVSTTCGQKPCI